MTLARAVAKLTDTLETPGTWPRAFSMRAAQAAQVIPSRASSTFVSAAGLGAGGVSSRVTAYPAVSTACRSVPASATSGS